MYVLILDVLILNSLSTVKLGCVRVRWRQSQWGGAEQLNSKNGDKTSPTTTADDKNNL